jgi:hypothetical protein
MPKANHSEIICIIDRSGSMQTIRDDAIGGFNQFLQGQCAVPGTAALTLILFDHEYLMPFHHVNIHEIPKLDATTYVPRGQTALLDAIGRAIASTRERLSATPEPDRPEKVIVCILTDGQENASHRFSREKIKHIIEHQRQKHHWEFIFLAANQDTFAEAQALGISKDSSYGFSSTSEGVSEAFARMEESVVFLRKRKDKSSS